MSWLQCGAAKRPIKPEPSFLPDVMLVGKGQEDRMPRVDPYKSQYDYDYEPSTSGAVLFVAVIAAIIIASLVWANFTPQTNPAGAPVASTQPTTPNSPPTAVR
jgi:hypothetical protein